MLRPRVIPCLLISNKGLVKTIGFDKPKYVGDPINAVRIFNEKEVDELIVLDIDATAAGREPDYAMIEHLAAECRMPLCYGGGVKTREQIELIVGLGVEKVALSSAAIECPQLVSEAAASVGSQSIVAVLDVRRTRGRNEHRVFTHNATRPTGRNPIEIAAQLAAAGVGEIVINSIDDDGRMTGYDLELAKQIKDSLSVPMTYMGGAGSLAHIRELFRRCGTVGAAAGSLFVFKGSYNAVLINYPNSAAKSALFT